MCHFLITTPFSPRIVTFLRPTRTEALCQVLILSRIWSSLTTYTNIALIYFYSPTLGDDMVTSGFPQIHHRVQENMPCLSNVPSFW